MSGKFNFIEGLKHCESIIKNKGLAEAQGELDGVVSISGCGGVCSEWLNGFSCGIKHFTNLINRKIEF